MTKLHDKKTYKNIKEGGQFLTTIFSHFLHDKVYLATTKYLVWLLQKYFLYCSFKKLVIFLNRLKNTFLIKIIAK